MKELKIEVKKGDIVYFDNGTYMKIVFDGNFIISGKSIVKKIERPVKYETLYEAPKQILDKEEKEYLEAVLKPFKNRVESIMKFSSCCEGLEAISIQVRENNITEFPTFAKGTMYKGMELNKEYTLKELGLFE